MNLKKILLVDDSEMDNFINKTIIEKTKIPVAIQIKTSALEALHHLKELDNNITLFPDIIFLDIRMPLMDGFQFMEEYIKLPQEVREKCKVYMLSSSLDPGDIQKSENNIGVEKYLTKPLAHHSLGELIDQ
ncbi:response regulator [Maribacter sp. X9]|uniref:response regulator n=1 Tax=Maribacter sp. X9 TaxID=3402159 RepID=UPI003AF3EA7E